MPERNIKNVSKLTLSISRESLVESTTENLIKLAKFLECPLWEDLENGPRRHKLINAIQRVEKSMKLNRPHPYKTITTIKIEIEK